MSVAPDLNQVHEGFARQDLFVCVHEQFMTETARMADIILPATMFLEHDDVYQGGGQQHIVLGPKIIEPPAGCRSNHELICALAGRLGAKHPGFAMSARELIDQTLQDSGWGNLERLEAEHWIDCQPEFRKAHYLNGFAHATGRFHFSPDWDALTPQGFGPADSMMPSLPDHWPVIEEADTQLPYRLVTAPAHHFLNSTFNQSPTSSRRERSPSAMLHPEDARKLEVADGDEIHLGNERGQVTIQAQLFDGVQRGVVIVEGIWPNYAFADGKGINALTGADPVAPVGGAAFHDNRIWIRPV